MRLFNLFRLVICLLAVAAMPTIAAADSGTLLVLNKSDNTVSLINVATNTAVATIPTGAGPHEVAVSPNGKIAVVANYGTQQAPGSSLTVIDVAGKKTLKTIDLGEYRRPHGIEWLRGNEIVVTAEGNKALLVVDIESGKVAAAVTTDQNVSHMVVLARRSNKAFVANIGSGSVTVIDLKTRKKISDLATGAGAEGIDISPDEKEVWVTNRAANTVSVIDVKTLQILATVESKDFPIRVKFAPGGRFVLVSNARSGDVAVFDAVTRKEVRRIPMQLKAAEGATSGQRIFGNQFGQGPVPVGILVASKLSHAFVANTNADIVTMIDLKTWQVAGRLTAGKEPDGLGYSPVTLKP
ncbi:MAG TPA: cytochrome D1 domain-containing protein [Pyrinomonadaceae bacterium]|nr:cytochrome D1 domain-containing protein [Pyrinomonadaceae bacterium]